MKDNQSVSYLIDMETETITFTVRGFAPRVMDMGKIHQNNINTAAYKGLAQQRVVDGAAVQRANKDGSVKSTDEMLRAKRDGMWAIIDHLESGSPEWGMRQRRAPSETDHSLTIRAMAEVAGKTYEQANAVIDSRAKSLSISRTAVLDAVLAKDARVAEKVREYRTARVADVDVTGWEDDLSAE